MNVRVVLRESPGRTDLYSGVQFVGAIDNAFTLHRDSVQTVPDVILPFTEVAVLMIDNEPGELE